MTMKITCIASFGSKIQILVAESGTAHYHRDVSSPCEDAGFWLRNDKISHLYTIFDSKRDKAGMAIILIFLCRIQRCALVIEERIILCLVSEIPHRDISWSTCGIVSEIELPSCISTRINLEASCIHKARS